MKLKYIIYILSVILISSCNTNVNQDEIKVLKADYYNGGLNLPEGIGATIVTNGLGSAKHIVIRNNGDIYIALSNLSRNKGIVALRDTSGDGKADITEYFGDYCGTGIDIYNGYLYFCTDTLIVKYKFYEKDLVPDTIPETVVNGLIMQKEKNEKSITINNKGELFVNISANSNACLEINSGTTGADPCPQLEYCGGIWVFDANKANQDFSEGKRYATGIKNGVALTWNTHNNSLYAVESGRDELHELFPSLYDENSGTNLPAEELIIINEGDNFGWPYCYFDPFKVKKVLAPEYGGNGELIGRCETAKEPLLAFPAHHAPGSIVFYNYTMLPEKYKYGAFIAFQGNLKNNHRAEDGIFVGFVPFIDNIPEGKWEVFADGFKENKDIQNTAGTILRPSGLAVGPDGSLYISDSSNGTIWRVFAK